MITSPELPSPIERCWSKTAEGGWVAYWTTYLKLQKLAGSLYTVAARRAACMQ
jgi:hypothetical protein